MKQSNVHVGFGLVGGFVVGSGIVTPKTDDVDVQCGRFAQNPSGSCLSSGVAVTTVILNSAQLPAHKALRQCKIIPLTFDDVTVCNHRTSHLLLQQT